MGVAVRDAGLSDRIQVVNANETECSSWEALNRRPFLVRHRLENHPLFEISHLVQVAESVARRGDPTKFGIRFERNANPAAENLARFPAKDQLVEVIRRIEQGAAWLKISSLHELDPAYENLRRSFLAELGDLTRLRLQGEVSWSGVSVFVASPNVVTPYHFDHDVNFLFQFEERRTSTSSIRTIALC